MKRKFTCVALSALTVVCNAHLLAQPVTTAASINYTETVYNYDINLPETTEYVIGTNVNFDFRSLGDIEVEYGPGPEELSAPAKDIPLSELDSFSMFAVDAAYRADFGLELPENVVGLRIGYSSDNDFEEDVLTVQPSGLYYFAYRYTDNDGEIESSIADDEQPFLPLNLAYGESFDTTMTYLSESQFENFSDSNIVQTTFQYIGYGTMQTWKGQAESIGAMLMTENELYFRADGAGNYGEPDEYRDTVLYLMTDKNVIPRAVLEGDYDTQSKVFTADYVGLLLPGSEDPSAIPSVGIPGATIAVFPNPGNGKFSVDFTFDRSTTLAVSLYSATGQLIRAASGIAVTAATNRIPVSTQTLPAGVYFLKLTLADGRSETRRVMVD